MNYRPKVARIGPVFGRHGIESTPAADQQLKDSVESSESQLLADYSALIFRDTVEELI